MDLPLVELHQVVLHEYFGHGGRARLSDAEPYRYHIGLPFPYGSGGGSAWTNFDAAEYSLQERAALAAGGIEVTTLSLERLEDRWLLTGGMDYREALYYFGGIAANVGYIRDAGGMTRSTSHDVETYPFETTLGRPDAEEHDPLQRLRVKALVELANFQLFLSAVQILQEYLVEGRRDIEAFRIPVAGWNVTPQVHLWLAPYGSEIGVRVAAAADDRLFAVRFRRRADATSVGLHVVDGLRARHIEIGGRFEVWRQPPMDFTYVATPSQGADVGILGTTTFRVETGLPFRLIGEIGAKTPAYVPGERLGAGLIVRAGIDLGVWF